MKVVLIKDVKKLGFAGDIVEASAGHARNFLFPQRLATAATATALHKAELTKATRVKSQEEMLMKTDEITALLKNLTLTFTEKVSSGNHLYGSVTEADIAAELKKKAKIDVSKDKIEMKEHIKALGSFEVSLHLPSGTLVPVKVEVKGLEAKEKAEKGKKKTVAKKK